MRCIIISNKLLLLILFILYVIICHFNSAIALNFESINNISYIDLNAKVNSLSSSINIYNMNYSNYIYYKRLNYKVLDNSIINNINISSTINYNLKKLKTDTKSLFHSNSYYLINNVLCKKKCIIRKSLVEICHVINDSIYCENISFLNNEHKFFNGIEVIYENISEIFIEENITKNRYLSINDDESDILLNRYIDEDLERYNQLNNISIINQSGNLVFFNKSDNKLNETSDDNKIVKYVIRDFDDLIKREELFLCGFTDYKKLLDLKINFNNVYLIDKSNCVLSDRTSLYTIDRKDFEGYYYSLNSLKLEIINFTYNKSFILNKDYNYYIFFNNYEDILELYRMIFVLKNNEIFYFDNLGSKIEVNLDSEYKVIENNGLGLNRVIVVYFSALDSINDQNRYIETLKYKFNKIYVVNLFNDNNYNIYDIQSKLKKTLLKIYDEEENLDTVVLFNYLAKFFYMIDFENQIDWNKLNIFLKSPIMNFSQQTWLNDYLRAYKNEIKDYFTFNNKIRINELFRPDYTNLDNFLISNYFYYMTKDNDNFLSKDLLEYILLRLENDEIHLNFHTKNTTIFFNNLMPYHDGIAHRNDSAYLAWELLTPLKSKPCMYYTIKQFDALEDIKFSWLLDYVICDSYDALVEVGLYI